MIEKTCSVCGKTKPIDDFPRNGTKLPRRPNCKACESKRTVARNKKNRDKRRVYEREWRAKNPDKTRAAFERYKANHPERVKHSRRIARRKRVTAIKDARLQKEYGLTLMEFKRMYKEQEGCCLICRKEHEETKLAVDHCHKTGVLRGLLCHRCNMGLGYFGDDAQLLTSAVSYLLNAAQVEEQPHAQNPRRGR